MAVRDRYGMRPMSEDDLQLVREWRNSERVRHYMYTTHVITEDEHRSWWERLKGDPATRYCIFELDNRPIGVVNIVSIDRTHNTANWGYYLGADDAPPGSGAAMAYFALAEVFENLGIRKLVGKVFVGNPRSIKLHEKFGFKQEGYRREHLLHGEEYMDVVEFALFGRDWPAIAERLAPTVFRG